jgi:hypothetical protein
VLEAAHKNNPHKVKVEWLVTENNAAQREISAIEATKPTATHEEKIWLSTAWTLAMLIWNTMVLIQFTLSSKQKESPLFLLPILTFFVELKFVFYGIKRAWSGAVLLVELGKYECPHLISQDKQSLRISVVPLSHIRLVYLLLLLMLLFFFSNSNCFWRSSKWDQRILTSHSTFRIWMKNPNKILQMLGNLIQ